MAKKPSTELVVAVIGDLVGSRASGDRGAVQRGLIHALGEATPQALQAPAPTIGDEFQAVYADVGSAVRACLEIRLALPAGLDCRTGIGIGTLTIVGRSEYGLTQDGPAWWTAREAVDEAARRAEGRHLGLRTWVVSENHEEDVSLMNAALLTRDEIVSRLDARQRRIVAALLRGEAQKDIAAAEKISASAVSQSIRRSGAWSIIDGLALMGNRT